MTFSKCINGYRLLDELKYTAYGRHLQANVGQCRNGDSEPQAISYAVIITAHIFLKVICVDVLKETKKERKKETKETR